MINPVTQLLMTKRAELNADLARYELLWRRGKISFEEYNNKTKELIKIYHTKYYSSDNMHWDSEPKGLLGIVLKAIRKLF